MRARDYNTAMQVYIEYVVLNNLVINALVLVLALRFCRWKTNGLAVFFASAIGTVYAVFLPLADFLGIFAFKILLSAVMVAIVTGGCSVKKYFAVYAVFIALTFALGGITTGLQNVFGFDSDTNASLVPFFVGAGGLALVCGEKLLYKHIVLARRKNLYVSEIEIAANGKKIKCKAYFDSGNKLYYHNKPTVIVDKSLALEFYKREEFDNIQNDTYVGTVAGQKKVKVFPLEYLSVEGTQDKIYGVMAAVSNHIGGDYKVVLHCDLQ